MWKDWEAGQCRLDNLPNPICLEQRPSPAPEFYSWSHQWRFCCCLVTQLCPTLCDPTDCSLSGSFVHGVSQARIPEWVAISFSRGYSQPRSQTCVSWAIREAEWFFYDLNYPKSWFSFCPPIRKELMGTGKCGIWLLTTIQSLRTNVVPPEAWNWIQRWHMGRGWVRFRE